MNQDHLGLRRFLWGTIRYILPFVSPEGVSLLDPGIWVGTGLTALKVPSIRLSYHYGLSLS